MSEKVKFTKSSGNVFLDIGFSKEEAELELLRCDLAIKVYQLLEEQKLTPVEAEKIFGLNPSDVERIQNGDFDFKIDKLFTILNQLNRNVEIHIKPSNEKGGHLRVVATS